MSAISNPTGLKGIEFIEFCSKDAKMLDSLWKAFGFSMIKENIRSQTRLYKQGDIKILVNQAEKSFSRSFEAVHGPCLSSMAWRFEDAQQALEIAVSRGAKPALECDYTFGGKPVPAIYGIGGSLLYFVDAKMCESDLAPLGFQTTKAEMVESLGFELIDHLTNNVFLGEMEAWANFYKEIFGFTEVRYFDIKGAKTGLSSYALKSPCGSFCIPINEAKEEKSQINEYLKEYKGAGVQHIAFLSKNILRSLSVLQGTGIETLDIDEEYYQNIFSRVPGVKEDRIQIQKYNVLVDGDDSGYLLQIFTKNIIGPIFIEIIQRENHLSFGEGNFGALFRSIEKDQEKRGVL